MGETERDYVEQVQLIKQLHHLPPPLSVNRFRLDRFSPYFDNATAEGIEVLGPHTTYQYVYRDLDIATVPDLFYFFDYVPHTVSENLLDQLGEEVRYWQRQYGTRRLWLDVDHHHNWTVLAVTNEGTTQSILSPVQAWLLQVLDTAHSEHHIQAIAKDTWNDGDLRVALDELCFQGWVVPVDGRFLSILPLTNNARILIMDAKVIGKI